MFDITETIIKIKLKKITLLFNILFLLTVSIYAQGFLVTYPKEPGAAVSENYTVYVNETPINVHKVATNNDVSYAHFSFAGKITVRVHINVLVKTYNLSPHGYGIVSSKSGQDIIFELDRPRKLVLQNVNSLNESLCIIGDPIEDNIPVPDGLSVIDVTTIGIDNTGATDNLNQIKTALNNLPANGILYFPAGRYIAGGRIPMISNKSIYLAGGAVLQASQAGELSLNFDNASNVKIFGRGSIDGLGDLKRGAYNGEAGACLLAKADSTTSDNCVIDGVILKGAITWTAIIMGTTNWTAYNLKVINGSRYPNHDAWDPHNAVNMMFDNCLLYGTDDGIAFSTTRKNLNLNTTFRNSVFLNNHYGATIRIGPWIADNTSNIKVENNDHLLSGINEHALAFWIGGSISNIKYLGNRVENARSGLILMRTNWKDYYAGVQSGSVDNVLFDRLTAETVLPGIYDKHKNQLEGPNAIHFVKNITFKDFYQGGTLINSVKAANMNLLGPNVSNVTFGVSTTPLVQISASSSIASRNSVHTGKFVISRSGGSITNMLNVSYKIHGNATNGTDYSIIQGSVTIPAGSNFAEIIISPGSTPSVTPYKTVYLSLNSGDNYILGPNYDAVVTIVN